MNTSHLVVHGTLRPDGTLELPQPISFPPGPVEVTIRPLPARALGQEDWWQYLQRARAELEAAGHPFRTKEEIDAEIEDLRSGDERLEEVYRQIEDERHREEQKGC